MSKSKAKRKPTVYLAARYSRRLEMLSVSKDLEKHGFEAACRWIKGGHQATEVSAVQGAKKSIPIEEGREFAREDVEDLVAADLFVTFTEEPRTTTSRGGRHVEFGMAWALRKPILVIGPRENVFHTLKCVRHHPRWHDSKVYQHLVEMSEEARNG